MKLLFSGILFFLAFVSSGQSDFLSGSIQLPENWERTVYLSVKTDYRTINIVDSRDIIARAPVDASGHFEFPKDIFTEDLVLYQLHVSEDANEVDVYISDYSENGIGYNFFVLVADNSAPITIEKSTENPNKIFGSVYSENTEVRSWLELERTYLQYMEQCGTQETARDHYLPNYHDQLIASAKNHAPLSQLIACHYFLRQEANLSNTYLKSYKKHRSFFDALLKKVASNYPNQAIQLRKELALIDVQIKPETTATTYTDDNTVFYVIISVLLIIIYVLIHILRYGKRRRARAGTISLSNQEKKIRTLILERKSNQEIADALFISLSTVKTHINSLYKKEGVGSRKELISKYSNRD